MKYKLIFLFPIIFQTCDTSDCPRKFEIPAFVIPNESHYKVGDTIVLHSKFHKVLQETNLNEGFNFEKSPPKIYCGVYKIDTMHQTDISVINKDIKFIENGSFSTKVQKFKDGDAVINGHFDLRKDSFQTEIKFALSSKGTFLINFGSNNYDEKFPGQCYSHKIYDIHTKMNDGEHNNIEFLRESPDSFYSYWMLDDPINRFHRFGGFCFKVVP